MPELPDITLYLEALEARVRGRTLLRVELLNPFLLRTAEPAISSVEGERITALKRVGKRLVFGCANEHWLVLHLMIAGRLKWGARATTGAGRNTLARFHFDSGVLTLTEAGSKRRASLHLVRDQAGLDALDPGGLEILECDAQQFSNVLTRRNHTLKRALTDPRLFSGIGNAYSDEILHAARLSPIQQTHKLEPAEIARLFECTRAVLTAWTERLREHTGAGFPTRVTACRDGMAAHGRYGLPCPVCGTTIQRIRYVSNELNYCPRCQTGGKLLADRALSRLLHKDWPRTIEALENGQSSDHGLSG